MVRRGKGAGWGGPAKGAGHGGPATGKWRPPFETGTLVGMRHGATVPTMVEPLAAHYQEWMLREVSPDYLVHDPSYLPAVRAWARAEARVDVLTIYIDNLESIAASFTETVETTSLETQEDDKTRTASVQRRITSALEQLRRYEAHAAALRRDLGLTPTSRWKMGRDVAAATGNVDLARIYAEMHEQETR